MEKKHKMVGLKEKYTKEAIPAMIEKFGYKNKMAVPKIKKVVLNIGFGKMVYGKSSKEKEKIYRPILNDLSIISGQLPVLTEASRSISGFKVRKGMPIGAKVTFRGQRMYDFLNRLIHIALPRSRDFRGIKATAFDKQGHLTIGIKEHICFPEILPEKTRQVFGFEITVMTTAKSREEGVELFKLLGFPIKT